MRAMTRADNTIRFALTPDDVRLAWTASGDGPPLVKAANWLTHLEYDLTSPVWQHWVDFLSGHFRYYRYDERGLGLSDHNAADLSVDTWAKDFEVVVEAARPRKPFVLLGISQGTGAALTYAARYPENVSHLVIYGGYLRGWARRDPEEARRREAVRELTLLGWGKPDPIFRRLYTKMFVPDASDEQLQWFDDLCGRSTTPEIAAQLMVEQSQADFTALPEKIEVPTLVMHARDDSVIPFSEGMDIASGIKSSEFVQLETRNHILLDDEPAWDRFKQAFLEFTGTPDGEEEPVFQTLSGREREVLAKVTEGLSNPDIAAALFISEKTVKNHITKIFEKLDVKTRSQAIVMARDRGFRGG
jgi:pimeloyl-ACP methyl ester carboxylesterase/DNA-binding CsgD family transcriptional regulator